MDNKLKIKHRKAENKWFIHYNKTKNKKAARFELLKALNDREAMTFFVDTSLGMSEETGSTDYHDISDVTTRDKILAYVTEKGLEYQFHTRKREEQKKLFGFSSGKKVIVEDILGGIHIEKGQLTEELFGLLFCTHDYFLGLRNKKPINEIFSELAADPYWRLDKVDDFEMTLVDSHLLEYLYTSYDFTEIINS